MDGVDPSLINWSRAQFAMTAMYHWIFVPLTLGLGLIMAIMHTIYYRTGKDFWRDTTRFWMKLFVINFAMGVATGLILEFQFGTNWSNYSYVVGDIFGAPLAIEGIIAFFLEATFMPLMFFGWNRLGKRLHLTATWMTLFGASTSAWWILVANAWMQYPVGMEFNPDTVRHEMVSFVEVAFSPVAIVKFFHTVSSCWALGAVFCIGVSSWYLLKKRHTEFALASIKIAAIVGLIGSAVVMYSGHQSAVNMAQYQPMKLAAVEGFYDGQKNAGLVAAGVMKPGTDWATEGEEGFLFKVEIPNMLSLLATHQADGYVPGIKNILAGGYTAHGEQAEPTLSTEEKMRRGKLAIAALADYQKAKEAQDEPAMARARETLETHFDYFGYGYLNDASEIVPDVPLLFYAFRAMIVFGFMFIGVMVLMLYLGRRVTEMRWLLWGGIASIPFAYFASQAGWIVAEVGRQPWAIQNLLPNSAAVSKLDVGSVQTTFFIFLALFTILLLAEIRIMVKAIGEGPKLP